MIKAIFNLFLKKNIEIKHVLDEPFVDGPITDLYYVPHIREDIDSNILDEIFKKREVIVNKEIFDKTNLTFEEFTGDLYNCNHPNLSLEEINKYEEKVLIDIALKDYNITKEELLYNALYGFDTEDLVHTLNIKAVEGETYDAYGSALYKVEDKEFVIFSSYDCGSYRKSVVISLCCYDVDNQRFEVADVLHDEKSDKYLLSDIQTAEMPEEVRGNHIRNFTGKRSFFWDYENKTLKLRCALEEIESTRYVIQLT